MVQMFSIYRQAEIFSSTIAIIVETNFRPKPPRAKKKPPWGRAVFLNLAEALLFFICALGSLERIDFLRFGGHRSCYMGCQVAVAVLPLGSRLRTGCAKPSGPKLLLPTASVACLHHFVAYAAVIAAAVGGHKRTVDSVSQGCTNHWYHLPIQFSQKKDQATSTWPNVIRSKLVWRYIKENRGRVK
jgi:hypothetical protein